MEGFSWCPRSLGLSPEEQEDFLKARCSSPFFSVVSQTKPNLHKPGPASPVQPPLCVPTSCVRPGCHVILPESSSLFLIHYPPLSPFSMLITRAISLKLQIGLTHLPNKLQSPSPMPGWSDEEESSLDMLAAQTWRQPWLPVYWLSTLGSEKCGRGYISPPVKWG